MVYTFEESTDTLLLGSLHWFAYDASDSVKHTLQCVQSYFVRMQHATAVIQSYTEQRWLFNNPWWIKLCSHWVHYPQKFFKILIMIIWLNIDTVHFIYHKAIYDCTYTQVHTHRHRGTWLWIHVHAQKTSKHHIKIAQIFLFKTQ